MSFCFECFQLCKSTVQDFQGGDSFEKHCFAQAAVSFRPWGLGLGPGSGFGAGVCSPLLGTGDGAQTERGCLIKLWKVLAIYLAALLPALRSRGYAYF